MRLHQYENLFISWSEQAHAAPRSLIDNIFREADEGWIERTIESDERKIVEASSMTLMLFLALWEELPHAIQPTAEQTLNWMRVMMHIIGAPEFDSIPGYRT